MMNLRIPLSVFVLASVIGLMAVTAIAAMSMQKAYSALGERWCFKEAGQLKCYSDSKTPKGEVVGAKHLCDFAHTEASYSPQNKVESGCEKQ